MKVVIRPVQKIHPSIWRICHRQLNETKIGLHDFLPYREDIYIGKDANGSSKYFGSPNPDIVSRDFEKLPDDVRKDYTVRKQILWESTTCTDAELSAKEVEFIRLHQSNNPDIGCNRWPKYRL